MKGNKTYIHCMVFIAVLLIFLSSVAAISTTPEDGKEDYPIDARIVIEFEERMNVSSVRVEIRPDPIYPVQKEWSNNDRTLTLTPTASLINEREYEVRVTGEDINGVSVDSSFSFTTEAQPSLTQTITDLFSDMWYTFWAFIPGIIFFVVILIIGYLISKFVGFLISKVLKKAGFEVAMRKIGLTKQIRKLGMKNVSSFIGTLVFWFIFVIFIQIALDFAGIHTLTAIVTPIVLFIPRIIIAVIVLLVGLYIAELAVRFLKDFIKKSPLGKDLIKLEMKTKKSGFSIMDFIYIFIKAFILLIFINIALSIIAINILADFINPILLVIPLLIVAFAVILIGLIVSEYIVKFILKMLHELGVQKLITPVEEMIDKKGIILKFISTVIQIFIMLIFVQIAVGILNTHGMFNMLADLVNTVILWLPNLILALFIALIGFWVAVWAHDKVLDYGKGMDIPFNAMLAKATKLLIIYIAIVMALAQIGVEVPILYLVFAIAVGAAFIGLGVGFAYGSKDLFLNMMNSIQSSQTLKPNTRVRVDEHEGVVTNVGRYDVVITTSDGRKVHIPHSKLANAVVEELS